MSDFTLIVTPQPEVVQITTQNVESVDLTVAPVSSDFNLTVSAQPEVVELITQTIESVALTVSNIASVSSTFETINKNLSAYPATLNYSGSGDISNIVYTLPSGTIIKTYNYSGGNLTSIALSGSVPSGISLTKTLNYSSNNLTGVSYS